MQAVTAMEAVTALAPGGGLRAASCAALGLSRASLHRRQSARQRPPAARPPRPSPQRALGVAERRSVLDLMREARFVDLAPAEIYATLLDQGVYRCCIRTMYRVLAAHGEVRERRDQLCHPVYKKPERSVSTTMRQPVLEFKLEFQPCFAASGQAG